MRAGFIVLDKNFSVVSCNQTIKEIWEVLSEQILGKSFFELEISYRPVDLRHRIEQVVATNEPLIIENVEYWTSSTKRFYLEIEIIPVVSGVVLFVENVTNCYELINELKLANKALELGHEKLLSANEKLENLNNQLQAINEELQSTNMEMESVNEDLKATNEELSSYITELDVLNQYNEMVLNSIETSIVVTDRDLLVKTWNAAAVDMWGSETDEVIGKPLISLNIGLPMEDLTDQLKSVIKTGKTISNTLEFRDHWGKKTLVDVSTSPLIGEKPEGLVLLAKKIIDDAVGSLTQNVPTQDN